MPIRTKALKKDDPIMYKGCYGTFVGRGERRDLCYIRMERDYVDRECKHLTYQSNLDYQRSNFMTHRGYYVFQVKRTSIRVVFQTNQEASQLLEVDY